MSDPTKEDIAWLEERSFKRLNTTNQAWRRFDAADKNSVTMIASFNAAATGPNNWYVSAAHHGAFGQSPREAYERIEGNLARSAKFIAVVQSNLSDVLQNAQTVESG